MEHLLLAESFKSKIQPRPLLTVALYNRRHWVHKYIRLSLLEIMQTNHRLLNRQDTVTIYYWSWISQEELNAKYTRVKTQTRIFLSEIALPFTDLYENT